MVAALVVAAFAIAAPWVGGQFRRERVRTAAFALRTELHRARAAAATRAANVAVVFDAPSPSADARPEDGPWIATVRDGNHNGVQRAEIASGVDPPLGPLWRLEDRFPGVRWGLPEGEETGSGELPGIEVGVAGMVSFSPLGGSGAGRLTLSGEGIVYAVVIHGGSSRIRVERRAGARWIHE